MTDDPHDDSVPTEQPIDGTLDLHHFAPSESKEIVIAYIEACLEKDIYSLRLIHGKGIGVQREIVHSVLKKHNRVKSYHQESGSAGSWGATLVELVSD